jgi:hypothetical protein
VTNQRYKLAFGNLQADVLQGAKAAFFGFEGLLNTSDVDVFFVQVVNCAHVILQLTVRVEPVETLRQAQGERKLFNF